MCVFFAVFLTLIACEGSIAILVIRPVAGVDCSLWAVIQLVTLVVNLILGCCYSPPICSYLLSRQPPNVTAAWSLSDYIAWWWGLCMWATCPKLAVELQPLITSAVL